MDTIRISKDVYKFLNSVIDSKHKSIHFRYFLATDFDKLITTDGWRMHIWPTDEQYIPGYYTFDKDRKVLCRLSDEDVSSIAWYTAKGLCYPDILKNTPKIDPLLIYQLGRICPNQFDVGSFAKITGRKDGKPLMDMTFTRKIIDGEERALCLGINTIPLTHNKDSTIDYRSDFVMLDAQFVLDALQSNLVHPIMRLSYEDYQPVIIGDMSKAHAVIMPIAKSGRYS